MAISKVSPPCRLLRSGRAEAVAPAAPAAGNLLHDDLAPSYCNIYTILGMATSCKGQVSSPCRLLRSGRAEAITCMAPNHTAMYHAVNGRTMSLSG